MAWQAPVGSNAFQPPHGRPSYGSQPYHKPSEPHGSQGHGDRSRKKKGNPVITRYPPPPGYRGQGNQFPPYQNGPAYQPNSYPQAQFGTQAYSPSQPGYQQNQAYAFPMASQPPNLPPNFGYPPPHAPYQSQSNFTPTYPQSQHAYHDHSPSSAGQPHAPPFPLNWQSNAHVQGYPPTVAPNAPPASNTAGRTGSASAVSVPTPTQPGSADASGNSNGLDHDQDDWGFDADGSLWPKGNDPINPDLSLGVIVWHAPTRVHRALSSNVAEAEAQLLAPPVEHSGPGHSVSKYLMPENIDKAFLPIRETEHWEHLKDNPIFADLPNVGDRGTVPVDECMAQPTRESAAAQEPDKDEDMRDAGWNVMDNLEQALSGSAAVKDENPSPKVDPEHNESQEDILAKLGVTGSPKPVTERPSVPPSFVPCLLRAQMRPTRMQRPTRSIAHCRRPPKDSRSKSYGGYRPSFQHPPRRYGSLSSRPHERPEPWSYQDNVGVVSHPSPTRSDGSHRTAVSSEVGDKAATEPGQSNGSIANPRKRSLEEMDEDRQHPAPRNKKRHSNVASAYRYAMRASASRR